MTEDKLKDRIIRDAKWYIRYRTTIWGIVWFIVGVFGGNVDRIVEKIPTLQYQQQEIQKNNEELQKKIDKTLDKNCFAQYNI